MSTAAPDPMTAAPRTPSERTDVSTLMRTQMFGQEGPQPDRHRVMSRLTGCASTVAQEAARTIGPLASSQVAPLCQVTNAELEEALLRIHRPDRASSGCPHGQDDGR